MTRAIAAWVAATTMGLVAAAAAKPVTLRFGQVPSTVHAVSSIYLYIAERKGFLAREGIRSAAARFVDLQYLRAAGVE